MANTAYGVKFYQKKKPMYDDSTMSKIGVYAAANVRKGNYFTSSSNKNKKFMQIRRNSQTQAKTPQIYIKANAGILSDQ